MNISIFITTLAIVTFCLSSARLIGLYYGVKEHSEQIALARAYGLTPLWDMLKFPGSFFIISTAWLVSLLF